MSSLLAFRHRDTHALFVGRDRGQHASAESALDWATEQLEIDPPASLATGRQVHSAVVADAPSESLPEADALRTTRAGVALCVFTADCVPLLVADEGSVVAIHAGWRGLANGIIENALAGSSGQATAWIGPCMAGCCYEVGDDVALAVARRSGPAAIVASRSGERPRLGLAHAAAEQLRRAGVMDVRPALACTGCLSHDWWSYRRSGPRAGRNYAFIWMAT